MAAATVTVYNQARKAVGDGSINFGTATIKVALLTSTYTPDIDNHSFLSSLTNEVTGSGYARQTLGTVTWTKDNSADRARLSSANVDFTAAGGSITARYAVFFVDTGNTATSTLLFYVLLDSAPADVVAADTQKIRLTVPANGWLEI